MLGSVRPGIFCASRVDPLEGPFGAWNEAWVASALRLKVLSVL